MQKAARCFPALILLIGLAMLSAQSTLALEYPYQTAEPQKTGWPLTEEEKQYVLKAEHERRPGREQNKHMPELWPVVPSAGFWGGAAWLDMHAKLVKDAQAAKGAIDVLLVGDSITMQWGTAWQKHFGRYKTVNIGIDGDKTQNVLWRLDHGGVAGIEPKVCVLLIGNNNMFFTPETGIESAARGIKTCVDNLREKFPQAPVIVVKVFPAHTPGNPFYEDIKKVNDALDTLKLEDDPKVRVLDIWGEMVNADGTLKKELFTPDNIHLTQEGGYKLYAEKLKPLLEALLAGKDVPRSAPKPAPAASSTRTAAPALAATPAPTAEQVHAEPARPTQVIYEDGLAAGWINNPINATVTLDNASPVGSGTKSIAVQTAPYGALQLLRWGTSLDTTRCKSLSMRINGGPHGGQNLRIAMLNGGAEGRRWQVVPAPEANTWTSFTISLADLGVADTKALYGLRLWEADGVESTYYVDDIRLSDAACPSLDGVAYDDAFRNAWLNNPFAATVEPVTSGPVHGGTQALAVTITGGGGCAQFSNTGGLGDTSPYASISFWINGGPEGGQQLQLLIKRWDGDTPAWNIPTLKANTWEKFTVPLSALGAAKATKVASIWFRDANTGKAQPTFYLDDIRFDKSSARSEAAPGVEKPAASAPLRGAPADADTSTSGGVHATAPGGNRLIYPYAPYNDGKMDPQLTGWPLSEEEKAWISKDEYSRKPGHEARKHLPAMWPVTPTAARWDGPAGANRWVENHARLVEDVKAAKDGIDILLLGDSITQYWGGSAIEKTPFIAPWSNYFGKYKTVNAGIGGDRTENVLWRLEHGMAEGASPKVIVLLIGTNDAPLVAACGVPAQSVAQGIKLCVESLRAKCPASRIVVVKILPAFTPGNAVYEAIKNVNTLLDELKLDADPKVHILDLWGDFANSDGSLKPALYADGHLHLSPAGYEIWAGKLKPLVEALISRK